MNDFADQVRQIVAANQYCTIVGETGSGKTTQVPQILLDEAIDDGMGSAVNIICTQPRRIAATSVAARVAAERGEKIGDTVGFHIRHDPSLPAYGGSITYCTTGILLQQLKTPDVVLDGVSHIILDEVHERDISLDFTLIMLKRAFIERAHAGQPVPKLIMMSATIDTEMLRDYFADSRLGLLAAQCPALHVPGRTFPVQRHFLNDIMDTLANTPGHLSQLNGRNLLGKTSWIKTESRFKDSSSIFAPPALFSTIIAHVVKTTKSGAILVFLPGMAEIRKLKAMLIDEQPLGIDFRDDTKFNIFQLHSLIDQDQRTVFDESPPGVRKIILSTNIAETSVTIPDVTVVIDSGLIRENSYNPSFRRSELQTVYVSQSNLNQRAGRAGRVQAGDYYGIFNQQRVQTLPLLPAPEMRRANLAALSLTIKSQRNPASIADFLADAVEPPRRRPVNAAIGDLTGLGAITEDENITALGQVLARLPLEPGLGKLIILAILFECLDPIILLGAAGGSTPWDSGTLDTEAEANQKRWEFQEGTFSEHLALLHAYRDLRDAVERQPYRDTHAWCRENYLRPMVIHHIDQNSGQIEDVLSEAGLIPPTPTHASRKGKLFRRKFGPAHLNTNSDNESLIRAVLAAGMQPNMVWGQFEQTGFVKTYENPHNSNIKLSMQWLMSLPVSKRKPLAPRHLKKILPVMLYDELNFSFKTRDTSMRTITPISPLTAALFGDNPRGPTEEDTEFMRRHATKARMHRARAYKGNLVIGRGNPDARESTHVPRLTITVNSPEDSDVAAAAGGVGNRARDMVLVFRDEFDQAMDRVLRKLMHNSEAVDDPAWRLFSDAIVALVEADDWNGLEQGVEEVERLVERAKKGYSPGADGDADYEEGPHEE